MPSASAPADPKEWLGRTFDAGPGEAQVESGFVQHWLEATENANPLYWNPAVAEAVTGGPVAPPSMLSVWMRPLTWHPDRAAPRRPLELHFQLKEAFGLPEGIVKGVDMAFGEPVRPGDRIGTSERVEMIGDERSTRLGKGREWVVAVTYRNQQGDVVGVETYRMFAYRRAA